MKEEAPIRTNYHSHTPRCGHATGSEEEYVQAALQAGYGLLGFSDHMPWQYEDGYISKPRMLPGELVDYVASVRQMQQKYQGQIEIPLGLEAEYQVEDLAFLTEKCQEHAVDFLLLGVHYDNRREEVYYGMINEAKHVKAYGEQALAGLQSGLFDCLAHPDLFMQGYPAFDDTCRAVSRDICQAAKAHQVPLEYNVSGFYNLHRRQGGLGYPCLPFWQIAAQEGVSAIIGIDAHSPDRLLDTPVYDQAIQHLSALGIRVIDRLGKG